MADCDLYFWMDVSECSPDFWMVPEGLDVPEFDFRTRGARGVPEPGARKTPGSQEMFENEATPESHGVTGSQNVLDSEKALAGLDVPECYL